MRHWPLYMRGNAAGGGGVLSVYSAESCVFPCSQSSVTVFDHLAVYLWSFFLSRGLNVVSILLLTKAQSMHVTAPVK